MNSTENYHLNQWEATDRVLRQDFNADNAKIDAALEEIRSAVPLCKLAALTLTEAASSTVIDLSAFDLSRFCRLDVFLRGSTTGICSEYLYLRCNDMTSGYLASEKDYGYLACVRRGTQAQNICYTTFCLYLGDYVTGFGQCGYADYSYYSNGSFSYGKETTTMAKLAPADLHTLTLSGDLAAGTQITVLGLLA